MKRRHAGIVSSVLVFTSALWAAPGAWAADEFSIVERAEHHRIIQTRSIVTAPDGTQEVRTNQYTELATDMHVQDPATGEWVPSNKRISVLADGAMVDGTGSPILFANNLNSPAPVTIWAGNQKIRMRLVGLAYVTDDSAVWISTVKDSIGVVAGDSEVIFDDAMNDLPGVIVRYSISEHGSSIEQDVILTRDTLPDARLLGLNDTVRLCAITEVVESGPPLVVNSSTDGTFVDQAISFGRAHIARGRAFLIGNEEAAAPVARNLQVSGGKRYIIESVRLRSVEPQIRTLPQGAALHWNAERLKRLALAVQPKDRLLASVSPAPDLKPEPKMRMASVSPVKSGLVIDWLVTMVSAQPLVLKGDTTYHVSAAVWVTNLVIEPNCVVKVARSGSAGVKVLGPNASVTTTTRHYGVSTWTCVDDNSRADTVSGSTGIPSGVYGGTYLDIDITNNVNLSHVRFLHAARAVQFGGGSNTISHAQFTRCAEAVSPRYAHLHLRNVLANGVTTLIASPAASGGVIRGEHWTLHGVSNLVGATYPPSIYLTNSLLVAVTNLGAGYSGEANTNVASDTGVFESLASGDHYLPAASALRDIPAVSSVSVAGDMAVRTTYAPTSMVNKVISTNTTWPRFVPRDSSTIGWHFPALDYYCSSTVFSNCTLLLTNGAAIGFDYSGGSWGFIFKNASFISEGSPLANNHLVRTHCVQENGSSNPGTRAFLYDGSSATASNEFRVRFTESHQLPNDGYTLYTGTKFAAIEWTHSRIYNPSLVIDTAGGNYITVGLTNTLIKAASGQIGIASSSANSVAHMRNCLLIGYSHHFVGAKATWTANDNLFDGAGLYDHGVPITNICNAYYNCGANVLSGGTSNLTLTNLTYVAGPFSEYYQPTNSILLDRGSTSATNVGLYHFTTTTNQVIEGTSAVDIGMHSVALDANGNPIDADSDGLPDYWEDRNGNGVVDPGELDWQNGDSDGDGTGDGLELLQGRNPFGGIIVDTNNTLNLRVYTPLK